MHILTLEPGKMIENILLYRFMCSNYGNGDNERLLLRALNYVMAFWSAIARQLALERSMNQRRKKKTTRSATGDRVI